MAELVEKFIEEICEYYAKLRKTELLDEDELRRLVKIHHGLLYKAARKQKRPTEFLSLVHFEMQVHKLIRRRRQINGYLFCPYLEKNLLSRVKRLNRALCYRFPGNMEHWIVHLALLHRLGQYKAVDRLLGRMLQQHADKPELWSATGRWFMNGRVHLRMEIRKRNRLQRMRGREVQSDEEEVEEQEEESETKIRNDTVAGGILSGRQTFLKGIKANPGSADLLIDYFAFELDAADFCRWRREEAQRDDEKSESVTDARLAELVWETIKVKFGTRPEVVERCAELICCVGWVRAERWTKEVLDLRRSMSDEGNQKYVSKRTNVPNIHPTAYGDPIAQVNEFELALQEKGSEGARKVWHKAAKHGWATVPLFLAYTALERGRTDFAERAEELRLQCERMAALSGARSPEFWLEFVRLEECWDPARAGLIDWRARKTLTGTALSKFAAQRAAAAFINV